MPDRILLKNARLACPESIIRNDLLIEGERIAKIGSDLSADGAQVVDCHGHLVMPGLIDAHVHFRQPGHVDKGSIHSESRAAVLGGVTSFLDMPNTSPPTLSHERLLEKKAIAGRDSVANYGFYLGATPDNLEEIKKAPPHDVAAVKIYLGSTTGDLTMDDEGPVRKLFEQCPFMICAHCEDDAIIQRHYQTYKDRYGSSIPIVAHSSIRSRDCCVASSQRAVALARDTGARLHIMHLSTRDELELLRPFADVPAWERQISAEACLPHLFFSDSDFIRLGGYIKCNPAIKREFDRLALTRAVSTGLITTIGSDHAPHEKPLKNSNTYERCPSGTPTVQFALLALLELCKRGELTLEDVVRAASYNVARRFGIRERGAITEGYYADLVVVSLDENTLVREEDVVSKCGFTPFAGTHFTNRIRHTFVSGRHVVEEGCLISDQPGCALYFEH